ncbi:MAG: sensor domain-containing diguanylate cyclase, partial [Mycetocola sp.]
SLLSPSSRLFLETRYNQVLLLQGRVDQVALTMISSTGEALPVLINSAVVDEGAARVVQSAIFDARERTAYEQDLLRARRSAELSERRLRILQEISAAFGVSTTDADVADIVVRVARDAFAATAVSFLLRDEDGSLHPIAGTNPLWGKVAPVAVLRETDRDVFVSVAEAHERYPELARGMELERLEGLSVIPLRTEHASLGLVVCFFERTKEIDAGFLDLQEAVGRQATQTLVRVRLQRETEHMARFDQLTGIANRQSVGEAVHAALDDAEATGQPLTVIFIDVDDFKTINDTLGHATGDAVLRILAERFTHGIRSGDVIGRIGGDEFIAICHAADADTAASVAERILALAREPIEIGGAPIAVSVSAGAAVYTPGADARPTNDALLNRADDAMYSSKAAGKNRIRLDA